jgi:hypothetical protein
MRGVLTTISVLLQSGLVAIGERQVAAARGQFQRQGAADALAAPVMAAAPPDIAVIQVGSNADGREGADVELAALNFRKLEPNHKAISSLIVDYLSVAYLTETTSQPDQGGLQWDSRSPSARPHSLSKTIRCNGT